MADNLADYKIFVDISKGYLDTALTAHIWFYAITGAVVSYYLNSKPQDSYIRYSLLLPLALGVVLVITCWIGWRQASALEKQTNRIGTELNIAKFPPVDILRNSLLAFGILDVFIIFGLVFLFWESIWSLVLLFIVSILAFLFRGRFREKMIQVTPERILEMPNAVLVVDKVKSRLADEQKR